MTAIIDGTPGRIAAVRALPGVGDLLCGVPALRALRRAFPEAQVTLIGLESAGWFVERFRRYIDELLVLPGFPGLPEQPVSAERFPTFLQEAHRRRFDLALQLHGSGLHTNALTLLLGAGVAAGSYPRGQWCPDERTFIPYPEGDPEIRRLLRVLEHLGVRADGDDLEFPVRSADQEELRAVVREPLEPRGYACVHPGASITSRRWPAERFARVGDRLAERGLTVTITGTETEAPVAEAVTRAMSSPAIDLSGRTSIGALAALVREARVVVSNDTGVSHLAAALRTPSVVVFTDGDPARWAPLDRVLHRAVVAGRNGAADVDTVTAEAEALLDMTPV